MSAPILPPELNRVHLSETRAFLRTIPDSTVHVVVTSPPYWSLRDYQAEGQIGLERTWDEHLANLMEVFAEVWRVLRPDGTLWLNYGDAWAQRGKRPQPITQDEQAGNDRRAYERNHWTQAFAGRPGWARATGTADGTRWKAGDQMLLPSRLAIALCDWGWWVRSENFWAKLNPSPMPDRGRPTYGHEHVYQLAKCANPYYDIEAVRVAHATQEKRRERIVYQHRIRSKAKSEETSTFRLPHPDGRNLWSYWLMACRACPEVHTATFPEELPETCIMASTSEHGACAVCGAPYKRIRKPTEEYAKRLGQSFHDHENDLVHGMHGCPRAFTGQKYETLGWEPSCSCWGSRPIAPQPDDAGDYAVPEVEIYEAKLEEWRSQVAGAQRVPCLVLDPFGGSGTTAAVAERLGRSHLSCDINPDYVKMANEWVQATRLGSTVAEHRQFDGLTLFD